MPPSRSASSLRRRTASSPASPWGLVTATLGAALRSLRDFDLRDLELAGLAVGQLHGHLVVALVADQGLADGRLVGELVLGRVGLGRADDRVLERLARRLVLDVDERAHAHDVVVELGGVDHRGRAQLVLERSDARLEHGLLVLGVVVLRVLGDVTELARFLDALRDLAAPVGGEGLDLLLEILESFGGEDDVLLHQGRPLRRRYSGGSGRERRSMVAQPTEDLALPVEVLCALKSRLRGGRLAEPGEVPRMELAQVA